MSEPEYDRKAEEIVQEISAEGDRSMEVEVHEDRTREFSSTSLARMRFSWDGADRDAMAAIHDRVDGLMLEAFGSAYQIMNDLYEIVREPEIDRNGEIRLDGRGWRVWRVNGSGAFVEDWSRLGHHDLQNFLFRITTSLFAWEQAAASIWGDSMFAKAAWEESLAIGYTESRENGGRTVEDRTQAARLASRQERLFGIFQSMLSRKADALVRSMTTLAQRLKDVLQAT